MQNSIEINPILLHRVQHLLFVFAFLLGNSAVCFVFFDLHGWKSRRGSNGSLVLLLLEGEQVLLLDLDVVIGGLQLLDGLVLMVLKLIGLLLLETQVALWLICVEILMLNVWSAEVKLVLKQVTQIRRVLLQATASRSHVRLRLVLGTEQPIVDLLLAEDAFLRFLGLWLSKFRKHEFRCS
jgi:hypothetical protein|tara:strand:- start:205 stop:747 length:543 start_codon:yes stop_codon:yes gene_type:complete